MADSLPLFLSAYLRECRETARFVLLNTVNDCETLGWRALGATFLQTEDYDWLIIFATAAGPVSFGDAGVKLRKSRERALGRH